MNWRLLKVSKDKQALARLEADLGYSPAVLDDIVDDEAFARLSGAVSALERQAITREASGSIAMTLKDARNSLIEAQHDIELVDRAIAMGAYRAPQGAFSDYFGKIDDLYQRTVAWMEQFMAELSPFSLNFEEVRRPFDDRSKYRAVSISIEQDRLLVCDNCSPKYNIGSYFSYRLQARIAPEKRLWGLLGKRRSPLTKVDIFVVPDHTKSKYRLKHYPLKTYIDQKLVQRDYVSLGVMSCINQIPKLVEDEVRQRQKAIQNLL